MKMCVPLAILAVAPTAAWAQDDASAMFTGGYAGPEAAAANHHFVVDLYEDGSRQNVLRWGAGAGGFAGYMTAISPKIVAGGEFAFAAGGRTPRFDDGEGTFVELKPRWGYSAIARLGYAAAPRTQLFVEGGYGAHRYRVRASEDVDLGAIENSWVRSFVLGAGIEQAVGRKVAVRARFQHLDGTRNQFLVGVPIRF